MAEFPNAQDNPAGASPVWLVGKTTSGTNVPISVSDDGELIISGGGGGGGGAVWGFDDIGVEPTKPPNFMAGVNPEGLLTAIAVTDDGAVIISGGGGGGGGAAWGPDTTGTAPSEPPVFVAGLDQNGLVRPLMLHTSLPGGISPTGAIEALGMNLAFSVGASQFLPLWQGGSLNHGNGDFAGSLAVETSASRTLFIADDAANDAFAGGFISTVVIGNPVASGVFTVYDHNTASGTDILFRFTVPATYTGGPISLVCGGWSNNGIMSCQASVAMDVTVTYR